jgi:hypothetical protein
MTTIVTRISKVVPLTITEVDQNFINLNNDKLEKNGGTLTSGRLTSTRVDPRVSTLASASSISPDSDITDMFTVTALAETLSINAPTGTPVNGQRLTIRFKDNGTSRALSWQTSLGAYRAIGTILPTTTIANKTIYAGCIYNSTDSYWDVIAIAQEI